MPEDLNPYRPPEEQGAVGPYNGPPPRPPRRTGGSLIAGFVLGIPLGLAAQPLFILGPKDGVTWVHVVGILGILATLALCVWPRTRRTGIGLVLGMTTAPFIVFLVLAGVCVAILGGGTVGG